MKKLNTYKNTTLTLAAFAIGMTLMGCAEDAGLSTEIAQQLAVTPLVESSQLSRANTASDASLNEDKLSQLNVKIYGEYDECKVDKTFTDGVTSKKKETIGTGNWKVDNDLQENKTYTVKAVANYTGTDGTLTDADIWKPYDATSNSGKTFLMSSTQSYTVTQEPTQNIDLNLSRAAAKILVTLHVNIDGYTVGQPTWQLMNYNAKTTVFGDNTESDIKESAQAETTKNSDGTYTITTYSYATSWTDDDKAPAIYLTLPLTATGSTKAENNYFKIPVRDPKATGTDAKTLARNTLYSIDATIDSKGGSSEVEDIEAGKVVYDVLAWSDGGNTKIDANTSYLMVYPQTVYMNNIEDDTSVTYKSSSAVSIKSKKVYYVDNEGNTEEYTDGYTEYYPSGSDYWNGTKYETRVYPYPKKLELTQDDGGGANLSGKITINSPLPQNRFAKYIVIELLNEEGKTATVKYKQSPLIETQNFSGYYSSRSTKGWVSPSNKNGTNRDIDSKSGYGYYAKYYENNQIKCFNNKGNANGLTNNRMYIIQVSSTKDSEYKVAHANIGSNEYTTDEVVSPAFMIASQLGAVYSNAFDQSKAKTHCETYREVALEDGKEVAYDGWRLPTKTEISFIVKFQQESFKTNTNSTKQPIKPVLEGSNYYTLNNESVSTGYSGGGTYVRCVRDLTPAEVDKLDKQMK